MNLRVAMIETAYKRRQSRGILLPLIRIASGNLSTLDVRIFDFVRNQFLGELQDAFIESFDYKTTITKKELGYIEGGRGHFMWRLKFEIVHKGDSYTIETTLHTGTSFQDAKFTKFETGQQDSIDDMFKSINEALAQVIR